MPTQANHLMTFNKKLSANKEKGKVAKYVYDIVSNQPADVTLQIAKSLAFALRGNHVLRARCVKEMQRDF